MDSQCEGEGVTVHVRCVSARGHRLVVKQSSILNNLA